jgi:hypothetical protein
MTSSGGELVDCDDIKLGIVVVAPRAGLHEAIFTSI